MVVGVEGCLWVELSYVSECKDAMGLEEGLNKVKGEKSGSGKV